MRKIKEIHLHCSASLWGNAEEIARWHVARGWDGIGYHAVILNSFPFHALLREKKPDLESDGMVEYGRVVDLAPASVKGRNKHALAVCLVGMGKYSKKQLASTHMLVAAWSVQYGISPNQIYGHCELDSSTLCPLFDMDEFRVAVGELLRRGTDPKHAGDLTVDKKTIGMKMLAIVDRIDPDLDDKIQRLQDTWTWNPGRFRDFVASTTLLQEIVVDAVVLVEKAASEIPIVSGVSEEKKIALGKVKMEAAVEWLNDRIDIPKLPEIMEGYILRAVISIVIGIFNRWGSGVEWLYNLRPDLDDRKSEETPA